MNCYVDFHETAPCGFLIVKEGGDPYNDDDTVLVQVDYDFPSVASWLGWSPCHRVTDGTIDCSVCGEKACDLISDALNFLLTHEGELFEDPGYFEEEL